MYSQAGAPGAGVGRTDGSAVRDEVGTGVGVGVGVGVAMGGGVGEGEGSGVGVGDGDGVGGAALAVGEAEGAGGAPESPKPGRMATRAAAADRTTLITATAVADGAELLTLRLAVRGKAMPPCWQKVAVATIGGRPDGSQTMR